MSLPKVKESISLQEAKDRALRFLGSLSRLDLAGCAQTALHVWPGHGMRAQGAGLAAARILELLNGQGWAAWTVRQYPKRWGWYITAAGRAELRRQERAAQPARPNTSRDSGDS